MKKLLALLLIGCFSLSLSACSEKDVEDAAKTIVKTVDRLQEEETDTTVLSVKNAENSSYPGITYGDAFDSFFAYPSWIHFTGSTDDSDEEHEIVEFTGNCTYQDVEVEALVQFTLYDDGTFKPTYLSFNEVPQTMLMLGGLLQTVFENYSSEGSTQSDQAAYGENTQSGQASSSDTLYYGTGYTITLSDDWVQQGVYETGEYDLSFVNYTDSGSINVYVTNDGYDNMGFYLNHIDGADGQFFLNDQVYEEMNDRYYTEYYFSADGNYHMGCYAGTDSHIYIFSFTTNDETAYYKLRDSVKNSFASANIY